MDTKTNKAVDPLRAKLLAALRATDTQHPLRLAVGELLADAVKLETLATASARLTMEQRQFESGRLAHALDLRELWEELGKEAVKEPEE